VQKPLERWIELAELAAKEKTQTECLSWCTKSINLWNRREGVGARLT